MKPTIKDLGFKLCRKGIYRGISFELVQWKDSERDEEFHSNYYIYINEKQVPREHFAKIISHEVYIFNAKVHGYRGTEFLMSLSWHGDMTFYDLLGGKDGISCVVKAGCDYSHLADMERGFDYKMEDLLEDVCNTIDDLGEKAPWLKIWCRGCGALEAPFIDWNGLEVFYCEKCKEKNKTLGEEENA
jgi:hypothetical protein